MHNLEHLQTELESALEQVRAFRQRQRELLPQDTGEDS